MQAQACFNQLLDLPWQAPLPPVRPLGGVCGGAGTGGPAAVAAAAGAGSSAAALA
jgi:hypothetical protein